VMNGGQFAGPQGSARKASELTCCWVGLMGPQDGVDLALRAVAHLVHEMHRTNTQFVFAGTGDALPVLKALATELELNEWVTFPGWLNFDEVAVLLEKADIGLEPNLEDFVSPVKVMEYMAHALPTVAFDLRETRNIVGTGGLFASPGDFVGFAERIESLLLDPITRWELGAAAQDRVRSTLSWEHQERQYLELYRTLLPDDRSDLTLEMA
jgi:glycosyltransferase involved in cell wall biosynthesis